MFRQLNLLIRFPRITKNLKTLIASGPKKGGAYTIDVTTETLRRWILHSKVISTTIEKKNLLAIMVADSEVIPIWMYLRKCLFLVLYIRELYAISLRSS